MFLFMVPVTPPHSIPTYLFSSPFPTKHVGSPTELFWAPHSVETILFHHCHIWGFMEVREEKDTFVPNPCYIKLFNFSINMYEQLSFSPLGKMKKSFSMRTKKWPIWTLRQFLLRSYASLVSVLCSHFTLYSFHPVFPLLVPQCSMPLNYYGAGVLGGKDFPS